jgi:hypothetical protein
MRTRSASITRGGSYRTSTFVDLLRGPHGHDAQTAESWRNLAATLTTIDDGASAVG